MILFPVVTPSSVVRRVSVTVKVSSPSTRVSSMIVIFKHWVLLSMESMEKVKFIVVIS